MLTCKRGIHITPPQCTHNSGHITKEVGRMEADGSSVWCGMLTTWHRMTAVLLKLQMLHKASTRVDLAKSCHGMERDS